MGRFARAWSKRGLLLEVALLLFLIRLSLILFPVHFVRRFFLRNERVSPEGSAPFPSEIPWAVSAVSRYLMGNGSCLPRALATMVLLERRGCPAVLQIGVAKGEGQPLRAHAWVESRGIVVMGGAVDGRYLPLAVLQNLPADRRKV